MTAAYERWNPWTYQDQAGMSAGSVDLVGFDVEATDGGIGKIDEATYDAGASHVVVDTGPWIFGSKVMLPAGTISRVDQASRKVRVSRAKEEIKNAPKFEKDRDADDEYRNQLGEYYGRFPY